MSGLVALIGTDNGIVNNQHSLRSKVVYYERTIGDGDGTGVLLTGAGFPPVAAILVGSNAYFGFGGGFAGLRRNGDPLMGQSTTYYQTSDYGRCDADNVYRQSAGSGQTWYLRFTDFTADGGEVTFITAGTPTSSLKFAIMWLR